LICQNNSASVYRNLYIFRRDNYNDYNLENDPAENQMQELEQKRMKHQRLTSYRMAMNNWHGKQLEWKLRLE
jgi:hypothetical protein